MFRSDDKGMSAKVNWKNSVEKETQATIQTLDNPEYNERCIRAGVSYYKSLHHEQLDSRRQSVFRSNHPGRTIVMSKDCELALRYVQPNCDSSEIWQSSFA